MPVPGSTVNSLNRNKTCPSPSFDARVFKNAKWSSNEDVSFKDSGSFKDLPQTWAPRNNPSPSPDRKDFKPVNFDSNSLKRSKRSISTDSGSANLPPPTDSFAWKDTTLERQLREIKEKTFSDAPDPKAGRDGANDKGLDKSLQNWANKPLPKAEDPDVILLKKARQEKKVKRYLEDNFQNREGNYASEPESNYDSDIGALSSKYTSLDRRRNDERSSPPKSPPPFSKAESRFEREQRIRVGSLDSYTPGSTLSREKSLSPPPTVSAAQKKYERERFRVEPGRIENYTLGRGNLANQEAYKAGLATSASGCGITKYSSSHSFNPLLLSKSAHNLSVKKGSPADGPHLQKTLKDGYESDSTLVYRKHHYTPCASPSPQAKALYTQVQKGGDVPLQGLRMQAPEKKDDTQSSLTDQNKMINEENIKVDEQEKEESGHEIAGEIEVFSTHCEDDDEDDDIINLDGSSPTNEEDFIEDDDPGFIIVTEDKGTNCPSINGSLRKESKSTNVPSVNGSSTKGSMNGKESEQIVGTQETLAPPAAPKRQNKRWSKLMKYTLPSKNPDIKSPKQEKKAKDRKSLKDKMKENDFVVFLTERRAVSESRFRVLDKIGSPGKLVRTKSDQSVDESWNTGISTGTITDLKSKFESQDEELIFDLQSPVVVKDVMCITNDHDAFAENDCSTTQAKNEDDNKPITDEDKSASCHELSKSSGSSNSKINESSPDSGNEEKKLKNEKKGDKSKKAKEKKEKKKHCDTCTTEKEHREHRKEKKRAKKERQERKREKEASMNNLNMIQNDLKKEMESPVIPPYPSGYNQDFISQTKVNGENFFQKLLIRDELETNKKSERPSRPVKKEKRPSYKPSEPALGKYLKGKQAVTDSKFKQYDEFERFVELALLPKGVIKCEEFNEKKSIFEPTRPSSSLSRVSPRLLSMERPMSSMSNRSASEDRRSLSLPRPSSAMSQASQASNSSYIIDQAEYHNYVYEMIHSTQKNPRFNQLTNYFNTLEKVTKLESESSNMDVHKLKSEDIVDFETWRHLRKQEKAKDELNDLLKDLRKAQKEREFHFRPKEVESVRWKGDSRLRGRDKSVENLKNLFTKMGDDDEQKLSSTTLPNKDHYRLYWRPKSVTDLTRDTTSKSPKLEDDRFTTYPRSRNVQSPYNVLQQQRSRSSLSMDQVSSLKNQLNDILSAKNSNASSIQSSRSPSRAETYSIEVKGKGEPLQSMGLFVKPIPDIVKKSLEEAEKSTTSEIKPRSKSKEDEERVRISKTINDELLKKVNFHSDVTEKDTKKKINFDIEKENEIQKVSPRTCHSLERESSPNNKHNEENDFILVLSEGEQQNEKVGELIDKWASGPESEDETKIKEMRKKMKGRLSGFHSSQSSESISSGTSVHTVIFKGVKNKAEYFEKMKIEDRPTDQTNIDVDTSSKSIDEIRKSFENIKTPEKNDWNKENKINDDDQVIPPNMVKEMRKSFENMPLPDPPTEEELRESCANSIIDGDQDNDEAFNPSLGIAIVSVPPEVPQRSSSYQKPQNSAAEKETHLGSSRGSGTSLDKSSPQSKSASSIPDLYKDEGYATFPNSPRKPGRQNTYLEKTYIPEKSISNVDLTDNENNSLDETFGKMHEKVHSLGNSCDLKDSDPYDYDYKSLQYIQQPPIQNNPTKYNRAYLTLSKAGDVKEKLSQFENKLDGKPLRSLPNVDINYIKNNVTDTNKVVIRNQEISDVSQIKSRLEKFGSNKDKDLFEYCGALLTKEKLKHFCKKMGHSKIISKMASLQKSAHVGDDDGFKKLNIKACAETEYITKYRSGEVESKKTVFEQNRDNVEAVAEPISLYRNEPMSNTNPSFSWSTRFDKDLPVRAGTYSTAQKNNQFRHYYGYHPTEVPSVPKRIDSRMYPPEIKELNRIGSRKPIYQPYEDSQPASLPASIGVRFNPQLHQPQSRYVPFDSQLHNVKQDFRMLRSSQFNSGATSLPYNRAASDRATNCRFGELITTPVSRKGS